MDIIVLNFFAGLRSATATFFAAFFSFAGEERLLIPLAAAVYWCADELAGERLLLTLFSSATLNAYLKKQVRRLRPFAAGDAEKIPLDNFFVSTEKLKENASFPSGHAQLSAALYGGFAFGKKGVFRKIAYFFLLLFICIARVYLGVHYPTDVLTGAFLGLLAAAFWQWVYTRRPNDRYLYAWLFCIAAGAGALATHAKHYLFSFGALCGVTAGGFSTFKAIKQPYRVKFFKKCLRFIVGIAGMVGLYYACGVFTGEFYEWLYGFASALWIVLIAPFIFKIFKF